MKKLIWPIIIVVIVVVVGIIFITKNNEEKEIKDYVNSNYQELENIVLSNNDDNHDKYIKYIERDNNLVLFYVKDNMGFYYAEDSIPKAIKDNSELIELGNNKYTWNNGTIIKIKDNWYYFKLKK